MYGGIYLRFQLTRWCRITETVYIRCIDIYKQWMQCTHHHVSLSSSAVKLIRAIPLLHRRRRLPQQLSEYCLHYFNGSI